MSTKGEKGIALITSLLVLFLISGIIVGMSWMVMTDQRLGGNNANHEVAFYGAEAGMEKMTADLGTLFNEYGSLTSSNIATIVGSAPTLPGITFVNSQGQSTYTMTYPGQPGNPTTTTGTIQAPSPFAGLNALITNYTLNVTAEDTTSSGEVKLQRIVQLSDIPVFQFGIFSNMDLSFFAGPDFTFGGRVHSNGNLWLAQGDGGTLQIPSKVTTAKEIVTNTLENGWLASDLYNGIVDISNGSSYVGLTTQTPNQSVSGTTWNIQTLAAAETNNSYTYNTGFSALASGTYNGNIGVKETGVTPLNLSIVTASLGGQAIDLIRMPVPGEQTTAPAKLGLRYYSEASMRILLADYGPSGTCADSDISSAAAYPLPEISTNTTNPTTPVDLATLAWDTTATGTNPNNGTNPPPYNAAPSWLTAGLYPLPVSAATGTTYPTNSNGYWVRQYWPIITGCIKIDYQSATTPGTFTDVTKTILNLGYTGQQLGNATAAYPVEPTLTTATMTLSGCAGLTLNANSIVRLARLRDNPSGADCVATTHGRDYWPNVLFDAREGTLRDSVSPTAPANPDLAGTMDYVELDIGNLSRCFTGAIATCATFSASINNTTGYTVYFSDRRGNRFDPNPPASVPPTTGTSAKTGSFGYEDFVNPSSAANGCPNGTLDQGEDVESDYNSSGNSENTATTPRTYGAQPSLYTYLNSSGNPAIQATWANWAMTNTATSAVAAAVLSTNSTCTAAGLNWPFAVATTAQDVRQNSPLVFRRALKLINGKTISLGTCNGVVCGLTVAAENPVYIQGDYNNPGAPATCTSFTQCFPNPDTVGGGVAASVAADAVTLLSNSWNDVNSFLTPYSTTNRLASPQTTYRLAIAGGKGIGFPDPSTAVQDCGTDGGVHNYLRELETWTYSSLWYSGSFAALFYNHQAVGIFKRSQVYAPPTRQFQFDSTFSTPADLPPRTPMLRNVNTIGFTQEVMPTQ